MHKACNAEGALKTAAADQQIPIPTDLFNIRYYQRGFSSAYVFAVKDGISLAKASFERTWISMMYDAGLVKPREGKEWTMKDSRQMWTPIITPHYLRHNYITMLWLAGIDPLVAMRLAGHSSYQVTANIYTHLQKEHVKRATLNIDRVFSGKATQLNQATI